MPENDESRAKLAAKRALEVLKDPVEPVGIAETPEARKQRFASRSPEDETPEQRSARYLEKARRAGMLEPTPTSPLNVRNEIGPPVDIDLDSPEPDRPLTWSNAADELGHRLGRYVESKTDGLTPEQQSRLEAALMKTRAAGEMVNLKAQRAIIDQPGAQMGADAGRAVHRAVDRATEYANPQPRQPIQMERTFSNDADKEAYLERIRQAQRAVK